MVAFISGDHEQRVGLIYSVRLQASEKLAERVVVHLQLRDVLGFTWAECVGSITMALVRIRDVVERDGYTVFLHRRDIRQ